MSENALTFSELRKIQKEEKREEDLTELGEDFLLRVSNYLRSKRESSGEGREYKNAKRVFKKIVSLREDKIVKNAKISVKTEDLSSDDLMLPREKELYRQLKEVFHDHRDRVNEMVEDDRETSSNQDTEEQKKERERKETETGEMEDREETENNDQTEEGPEKTDENSEEGYTQVRITSDVPEFMGTDLETYGPFEEGDKTEIPEDNAEILVNRGNAEEV
ncbi:MAG: hypothetical protein ABEK00_02505 [Candidatus Nanohaloarchaea archaeon]